MGKRIGTGYENIAHLIKGEGKKLNRVTDIAKPARARKKPLSEKEKRLQFIKKLYRNIKANLSVEERKALLIDITEFTKVISENADFNRLYDAWIMSGKKENIKPSIIREDSRVIFSFSNMKITTKGFVKSKSKKYSVYQLDLNGNIICEFDSVIDAVRSSRLNRDGIYRCVRGITTKCGDFKWVYKDKYDKIIETGNKDALELLLGNEGDKNKLILSLVKKLSRAKTSDAEAGIEYKGMVGTIKDRVLTIDFNNLNVYGT